MDNTFSVQTVAIDAAPCSAMAAGAPDCLQFPTEPGLDAARLPGILAADQVEAVSGGDGRASVGNYLTVIDAGLRL
jgi:hypothetical protein